MNYKTIFKSQKLRFLILSFLSFIPDKIMLKIQYKLKMGRKLNFKNGKRFTEKIQKYKINYRNELLGKCVDKYAVRDYIKNKGYESILNDLYFVGEKFEDINFDILPKKFVVKTTDGGGGENIILCKDKNNLDLFDIKKKLDSWKNKKNINPGREWAYTQIDKSQIIIEQYLENPVNSDSSIEDYKFLCFNGNPEYVIIDKDRYINHKRNFYTIRKEKLNVSSDHEQFNDTMAWPKNYDEMVKIASDLSSDFPFVRVDLYNLDGKIYFGELTFYPWSGYVQFNPDCFDYEIGSKFVY